MSGDKTCHGVLWSNGLSDETPMPEFKPLITIIRQRQQPEASHQLHQIGCVGVAM